MTGFRLDRCRGAARVLLTSFLLVSALGFGVSVLQVHGAMGGLSPEAVSTTLRGAPDADAEAMAALAEELGTPAGERGLEFGRGYREMLQTAHTHSLSIPVQFLALGAIFLGAGLGERLKAVILGATFATIVLDLGGLWLTRYVAAPFAYLNVATGTVLLASAAFQIGRSLWDLWRPSPARAAAVAPADPAA